MFVNSAEFNRGGDCIASGACVKTKTEIWPSSQCQAGSVNTPGGHESRLTLSHSTRAASGDVNVSFLVTAFVQQITHKSTSVKTTNNHVTGVCKHNPSMVSYGGGWGLCAEDAL